jgi:hypothetical protein
VINGKNTIAPVKNTSLRTTDLEGACVSSSMVDKGWESGARTLGYQRPLYMCMCMCMCMCTVSDGATSNELIIVVSFCLLQHRCKRTKRC